MIPKIIHFCWLSGDSYPSKISKCLKSWEKYLPDYEIVLWDTKRFDINSSLWVKQAFEKKRYAFAADYIRFYALYTMGGIYLDSDVEVLKNFDDLLDLPYFIGAEQSQMPEAAIMGAEKGCDWIGWCLNYYKGRSFIKDDGSMDMMVVPDIMSKYIPQLKPLRILSIEESLNIRQLDMQREVLVFNDTFFSPIQFDSHELIVTPHTYTIHHFQNSWFSFKGRLYYRYRRVFVKKFGYDIVHMIEGFLMPWKFKR